MDPLQNPGVYRVFVCALSIYEEFCNPGASTAAGSWTLRIDQFVFGLSYCWPIWYRDAKTSLLPRIHISKLMQLTYCRGQ